MSGLTSPGLADHKRLVHSMCESCERRPAVRAVALIVGEAPFLVCLPCDLRALAAEARPTATVPARRPVAVDTTERTAERRAVLETF